MKWYAQYMQTFFRWKGSKHYPEGPRLVRVHGEDLNHTQLAPGGPMIYDGSWHPAEAMK